MDLAVQAVRSQENASSCTTRVDSRKRSQARIWGAPGATDAYNWTAKCMKRDQACMVGISRCTQRARYGSCSEPDKSDIRR